MSMLEENLGPMKEYVSDLVLAQCKFLICRSCSMHSPLLSVSLLNHILEWAFESKPMTTGVVMRSSMAINSSTCVCVGILNLK